MEDVFELVRCSIGRIVVSMRVDGAAEGDLAELPLLLRDFTTSRPADLRLTLRSPATPLRFSSAAFEAGRVVSTPGPPADRKRWIETVGSEPQVASCLAAAGFRQPPDICIPMRAGILTAALHHTEAVLFMHPAQSSNREDLYRFATAFNALMALLAFHLPTVGGALVHGTGVQLPAGGFLFVSSSGGGKTTLSRSAPAGTVLADDGVVVRRDGDSWQIHPTPFRQRTGSDPWRQVWCRQPAPLKALLFLEKGRVTRILSIPRIEALDRLANAHTHFSGWFPPPVRTRLFDFWRTFSLYLPVFLLQWRKGDDLSGHLQRFVPPRRSDRDLRTTP